MIIIIFVEYNYSGTSLLLLVCALCITFLSDYSVFG